MKETLTQDEMLTQNEALLRIMGDLLYNTDFAYMIDEKVKEQFDFDDPDYQYPVDFEFEDWVNLDKGHDLQYIISQSNNELNLVYCEWYRKQQLSEVFVTDWETCKDWIDELVHSAYQKAKDWSITPDGKPMYNN